MVELEKYLIGAYLKKFHLKKFVLAGGINPENIKEAVSMNPWCIDVNSGVESSSFLKIKL